MRKEEEKEGIILTETPHNASEGDSADDKRGPKNVECSHHHHNLTEQKQKRKKQRGAVKKKVNQPFYWPDTQAEDGNERLSERGRTLKGRI